MFKKYINIIFIMGLLLFFGIGCKTIEKPISSVDLSLVNKQIIEEGSQIQGFSIKVTEKADNIITTSQKIEDPPIKDEIVKNAKGIKEDVKGIERANKEIEIANSKVFIANNEINSVIKENSILKKNVERLNKDLKSALTKKIQWLIFYSIISLGVSAALLLSGSKFGIFGITASGFILIFAQTFNEFSWYFTLIGGILLTVFVIGVFWYIFIYKRAFKEVVKTVDIVKSNLTTEIKELIFGKDTDNGLMKTVQSKETEKIVKKEKNKIKNKSDKKVK
jgi:hypothetical protein